MRECMAGIPPPKRLRISELNPHLLCALCGGYLIDATTIIECLHSFCKTCILRYLDTSNYCPICEVLIHKTRPWQNIRLDHALQNAVYKMVPGLFQNEMKRRREFYEQQNLLDKYGRSSGQPQGEIGDRIIFSKDEEFSVSIEFSPDGKPVKETKTKHLKRPKDSRYHDKRYLKCPAGFRVEHLKKFIRSKFTLPQHIEIDLFYENEPLYDSYSLMDVAYIYLWRRDCVLQLFYSFFEVPTKKRKLQSVTHVSETLSKSSKVIDKPGKNFGDKTSTNMKEKADGKKQGRMSGKKKSTAKAVSSSGNTALQEVLVAQGRVSSNLKRKHTEMSSTRDCSWLSKSVSRSLDTPASSKYVKHCFNNITSVENCAQVHAVCQPGSKQTPASSDCSAASQQCRESTSCSIISHHSRESTACSVTSHFCKESPHCSIVSHPCVTYSNRISKPPAESQVSITLLIKSSDSNACKHENAETSSDSIQTLQNGEDTSQITYNTFLHGDTLSEIKDNSILTGGKFLEVKNTILKTCKRESKVSEMNIENGEVVSEVKVSLNGKIAPELTDKQLVNGQLIFTLKNRKIKNGGILSKVKGGDRRHSESLVMDNRCQSGNTDGEVRSITTGRAMSCEKDRPQNNNAKVLDVNVQHGQGDALVKNVNIHSSGSPLDVKYNNVHTGETASFAKGKKVNIDRISNVKDKMFHNDDIVLDIKDTKLQSFEKISNDKDKQVENNNKLSVFSDKSFQNRDVTLDVKDKKVLNVDVIPELKDEILAKGEINFMVKDKAFVQGKIAPTSNLFDKMSSVTNPSPVKVDGTMLAAMSHASSQLQIVDTKDKNLKPVSERCGLTFSYDNESPKTEDKYSQPQKSVRSSGKFSANSGSLQVLQSRNCVNKEQVMCNSSLGDSDTKADRENVKAVCPDTKADRENVKAVCPDTKADRENVKAVCPDTKVDRENVKAVCPDTNKDSVSELRQILPSTTDTTSAYIQKPSDARSEKTKMSDTQPALCNVKDVVSDGTKQNYDISRGTQALCVNNKVSSTAVDTINGNRDTNQRSSTKLGSISKQLSFEGRSNSLDLRMRKLPAVCSVKPNCVDKTFNSVVVTDTVRYLEPAKTTETDNVRSKDSVPTAVVKEITADSLMCRSREQHSAPNQVKNVTVEHQKQGYSAEVFKGLSSSEQKIEKSNDFSESVDLVSNNLPTTSNAVIMQADHTSVELPAAPSDKPSVISNVTVATSSPMPVPLTLLQSTVASTVSLACSPLTYSIASRASVLPTSSSSLVSTSIGEASSFVAISVPSLTRDTAIVNTAYAPTKTLPAKTCSSQSATTAAIKTIDPVSHSSIVAISLPTPQNRCLSAYTVGKETSHWSRRQLVSAGISNTPSLPQDTPPKVISSASTPTSGSSEVALPRVSGSSSIPLTPTSTNNDATLNPSVVSSFLNLPPSETSPIKQPQSRSHLDSTNSSAAEMTLPSEATKVDNFLFDVKSPEKELSHSRPQIRASSFCGKEMQRCHFRAKLHSLTELGVVAVDKAPKTIESNITAIHHLPKTISQTSRTYSVARSVNTLPSSNTKYGNSVIQTTKISTLIPKSNSVNSKAGTFPKPPSYPASVNGLLLSRSMLNTSLSSHYSRIGGSPVISGTSCLAQELMTKSPALSSPSSSTASSLLSSTTSTSHHRMSSTSRQGSKSISGRSDKSSKHKTIPPLCIPRSSLIGPTTLKLQRSPGSNDHYIFSPLLHYSPPSQHKVERSKSKESKHKGSHPYKSVHTVAKGNTSSASRQRVPTIKISDINRNPVIVENGGSGSSNSNTNYHSPYKSYNHGNPRSSTLENGTPRAHSRGRPDVNLPTARHDKSPVRDILRPSDSELLLSRHWHAYSTAELLFSGFSLPAHTKLQDLQYDTDAMPLDYSQSSSKS